MNVALIATILGIGIFIIVLFMAIFIFMLWKQMKSLDKIYKVLYDDNTNNLTLQSAYDIIEAQYNLSKYAFIEVMMRVHFDNNVHDPDRQKVIRDNLNIVAKNLQDRDLTVLSRLKYKNACLDKYLDLHGNYEKLAKIVYDSLISKYTPQDIIAILHNEFHTLINNTNKYLEKTTII